MSCWANVSNRLGLPSARQGGLKRSVRASCAQLKTSNDRYGHLVIEDDLFDQSCDTHGTERHMHIHEAGHAIAALDHEIPFGPSSSMQMVTARNSTVSWSRRGRR